MTKFKVMIAVFALLLITGCIATTAPEDTSSEDGAPAVEETSGETSDENTEEPDAEEPTEDASEGLTMEDVALHNTAEDCWTVVNGNVYDITSEIAGHPGGVEAITAACGVDGTAGFENRDGHGPHPEEARAELEEHLVGSLAE